MLDRGADLRLIMETLGHSQISVTADLYTHVLPHRQRAASEAVDALILGEDDDPGGRPASSPVDPGMGTQMGTRKPVEGEE